MPRFGVQPAAPALAWSTALAAAADRHSQDMARNNFFSHRGSDGSEPSARVVAAGYGGWGVAENIAAGYGTAAQVVQAWASSESGHCEALMSAQFNQVGGSCRYRGATSYGSYWTLDLARAR